jgi:hypothetical protein
VPSAPAQFVDPPNEFRLSLPLRDAALTFDSLEMPRGPLWLSLGSERHCRSELGDALADLRSPGESHTTTSSTRCPVKIKR